MQAPGDNNRQTMLRKWMKYNKTKLKPYGRVERREIPLDAKKLKPYPRQKPDNPNSGVKKRWV